MATPAKITCLACSAQIQPKSYLKHRESKGCKLAEHALTQTQKMRVSEMDQKLFQMEKGKKAETKTRSKMKSAPKMKGKPSVKFATAVQQQHQGATTTGQSFLSADVTEEDSDYDHEEEFENELVPALQDLSAGVESKITLSPSSSFVPVTAMAAAGSTPTFTTSQIFGPTYDYYVSKKGRDMVKAVRQVLAKEQYWKIRDRLLALIDAVAYYDWSVKQKIDAENFFDPSLGFDGNPTVPLQAEVLREARETMKGLAKIIGHPIDESRMKESFQINSAEQAARVLGWQNKLWFMLKLVVWKALSEPFIAEKLRTMS